LQIPLAPINRIKGEKALAPQVGCKFAEKWKHLPITAGRQLKASAGVFLDNFNPLKHTN
jgi:hypothetical protein